MKLNAYKPEDRISDHFRKGGRGGKLVSANERALLRAIWRWPASSRAEVMSRLDVTQQSVHRIVEHLAEREMLLLGEPKPGSGRGQPSPTLLLNPDWAYTIGISVNTDKAGITLMDLSGAITTRSVSLLEKPMAVALDDFAAIIDDMIEERGLSYERLFGIGFGIAGYSLGETRYNAPLPLHEWSLIELGPLLADRFDAPVWTENGANTAAICEAMLGVGRHIRSFAYLSFNYGFGGGLIIDGELFAGANGNAGEFSGIYDLDEHAKRPALQFLLQSVSRHGVPIHSIDQLNANFDPDWPGVAEWLDTTADSHNRIINAISATVDPQAIVYGGEIPRKLAAMLIARADFYRFNLPRYGVSRRVPKLIVSDLPDQPSAIGAAVLPFKAELL
ncbi:ROK family transcriptional regulator [uncultured Cohaesibacter sp.]|uniref:ROK family transcriptional regulator n=1 Tax=uncultured Cohaesibacter sp. TaxID=1002546 RepID=UPI0029C89496|nr:ROK family transcriptional regulator [uncultured Cohaesibacter sp.]